jgi:RsmE family RNA methyltransferase
VAHPGAAEECPRANGQGVVAVVGPEGGFIDAEVELLGAAGFRAVSLGVRALRVETAMAALMGRLF